MDRIPTQFPATACDAEDLVLMEAAHRLLRARFQTDRHEIGAALRTLGGQVLAAVSLDTRVGRMAVCAEAVAIGMAIAEGHVGIQTIVAVNAAGRAVAPCGACRELLADYAPQARVLIPGAQGPEPVAVADLLPRRYSKDGASEPGSARRSR